MIINRCLIVLLTLFALSSQAGTILVIDSYHSDHPWVKSYTKGLKEKLGDRHELVFFQMDTKRLAESQYQNQADKAWALYNNISPQLVILADDNAVKYMSDKLLTTDTPVVYLGVNDNPRSYKIADAKNFSGVLERPLLMRSMIMLKKFMPVSHVLLLLDQSRTSDVLIQDVFKGKTSVRRANVQIDVKSVREFESWKERVLKTKIEGYDAVFVGLYHTLVDANGLHVSEDDVIKWTSQHTPVPSFGFWDFSVGKDKNVGGYVVFGYQEGQLAGDIALDMLQESGSRVRPTIGGRGQFIFSRSQLLKWGLVLPPSIHKSATLVD